MAQNQLGKRTKRRCSRQREIGQLIKQARWYVEHNSGNTDLYTGVRKKKEKKSENFQCWCIVISWGADSKMQKVNKWVQEVNDYK